jgi:hypothetical protein
VSVSYLYAVRCNFTGDAAREAHWHAWYDGPKVKQMLELPLFLAVQRFAAVGLDTRRKYLALWQVASPEAFETPQYRAQWGFAEWTTEIADWSRDLYRGPANIEPVVEIGRDDELHFAAFDGLSEAEAREAQARFADRLTGLTWLEAIGLDRHAPIAGLRRLTGGSRPSATADASGLAETIFTPITRRFHTSK